MSYRFPLCIIPAAGKGTRMGGTDIPKPLRKLRNGQPVASVVISFWARLASRVVVVIAPEHREQWAYHDDSRNWPAVPVQFTEQATPGVCGAIVDGLHAAGGAPPRFVVGLGDCLFDGEFDFDGLSDFNGVGVMDISHSDVGRSYVVGQSVSYDFADAVIEKPMLGLGAYFFNWHALPALLDNVDITDVVSQLAQFRQVPFTGRYVNVTFPEDLQRW